MVYYLLKNANDSKIIQGYYNLKHLVYLQNVQIYVIQ